MVGMEGPPQAITQLVVIWLSAFNQTMGWSNLATFHPETRLDTCAGANIILCTRSAQYNRQTYCERARPNNIFTGMGTVQVRIDSLGQRRC